MKREFLYIDYWKYIFSPPEGNYWDSRWRVIKCRLRGHPNGEVFYNIGGLEPDHHCQDCGEYIG